MRKSRLHPNALVILVLLATGCEPTPQADPGPVVTPELIGGPIPFREARQLAMRSTAGLDQTDTNPEVVGLVRDRIIQLLAHRSLAMRMEAAEELGELRHPLAIDALLLAMRDPQRSVRIAALAALADIAQPDTALPISTALNDPAVDVRTEAARVLGRLRNPAAQPALATSLQDPAASVRTEAARALGWLRATESAEALRTALQQDDAPEVRAAAAGALGLLKDSDEATQEALATALHDPASIVRYMAVGALTALSDASILPVLRELRNDPDANVRRRAAEAIETLQKTPNTQIAPTNP